MLRALRFTVLALVVAALLPVGYFVGFGLVHGLDVGNGLRSFFARTEGETVDPALVPYLAVRSVEWLGDIEAKKLDEASGLDVSTRRDDLLWAINDSGNAPRLFALTPRGRHLGSWRVDLPELADWEALSTFRHRGASYLLIADTGDNFRWRRELNLYVLREPDLAELAKDTVLPVERHIVYSYPDGPQDVEAVAVDADGETVLLVSKRVVPATVYQVPLFPADGPVVAERIGALAKLPQPDERDRYENPERGKYRSMPTALDLHGDLALVVTYKDAYLYRRPTGGSWADTFGQIPERVALPRIGQQEAAAFSLDGKRFFTTTERFEGRDSAGIYSVEF
jgi:hypothetical protein